MRITVALLLIAPVYLSSKREIYQEVFDTQDIQILQPELFSMINQSINRITDLK